MAVFTAIILLMAIGVLAKLYHVSVVMGPDLIAKARERICLFFTSPSPLVSA